MIRTFIGTDISEVDKQVNAFLRERRINGPVRTEAYVFESKVWHKSTVFYDERFEARKTQDEEDMETYDEMCEQEHQEATSKASDKIGALWIQKNGKISGNMDSDRLEVPDTFASKLSNLKAGEKYQCSVKGKKITVIANKFKKTDKHPDYILYLRKECQ